MARNLGPPREKAAGPEPDPTATDAKSSPKDQHPKSNNGIRHRELSAQLRRRGDKAARCVPLPCGHRDPLRCLASHDRPPLTDHQLDGWRDAANHVLAAGRIPLVPLDVQRALWRRPSDRKLAQQLYDLAGGS